MTALAVGDLLSRTPAAEIVLAGCGLRGMGLLTATPALLDHRLTVVDAGPRPGPGGEGTMMPRDGEGGLPQVATIAGARGGGGSCASVLGVFANQANHKPGCTQTER
mgnify:CR=1 FL=1